MSVTTKSLLVLLLVGAVSCTSDGGAQPAPGPRATDVATVAAVPGALATPGSDAPIPGEDRLQPLTALGPCEDSPQAADVEEVPGLVLPDDSVVTQVSPADPLTNVQGYVPMTPVQIRAYYQQHPDLTIVSVEDEGFEAEVLFDVGDRRVFVKSQAVCELGSVFVAVVAPAP